MKVHIITKIKAGILDPQGKAIEQALKSLGFEEFTSVRQGTLYEMEVEPGPDIEATLRTIASSVLSNPVMEDYELHFVEGANPES